MCVFKCLSCCSFICLFCIYYIFICIEWFLISAFRSPLVGDCPTNIRCDIIGRQFPGRNFGTRSECAHIIPANVYISMLFRQSHNDKQRDGIEWPQRNLCLHTTHRVSTMYQHSNRMQLSLGVCNVCSGCYFTYGPAVKCSRRCRISEYAHNNGRKPSLALKVRFCFGNLADNICATECTERYCVCSSELITLYSNMLSNAIFIS